jgi:signal transduction histidine kinase
MKIVFKIFLFLFFFSCSNVVAQQSILIDSLKKVLINAKEDTGKVNVYIELAVKFNDKNDYEKSLQYGDSALAVANKLDFKIGIGRIFQNKGVAYFKQGNYPKALENYQSALKLFKELGDKVRLSNSYSSVAVVYRRLGNYPEATKNHFVALRIREEIGDKCLIADSYLSISSLYGSQGNFEESLKYSLASLDGFKACGKRESIALTYNNIALNYTNLNKYQDALDNFSQAIKINEELGRKAELANCYNNMSTTYISVGNWEETYKCAMKCVEIHEELGGEEKGLLTFNINAGIAMAKLAALEKNKEEADKKYNEALRHYSGALKFHLASGYKQKIRDAYKGLADVYYEQRNFEQALENYKLFMAYNDSIFNEQTFKQAEQFKIQYETEKKDKEIALISKENEIKSLQLTKQEAILRNSRLESEKNQTQILLLNTSNEVQQLTLTKTQKELAQQQAEAKAKAAELELIQKDKQLKEQQLEKQKIQRNGILVGVILLILVALLIFRSIQLKRKLEKQQAISQERKRISADLHDDIGSGLSKISLLSEMLKKDSGSPEAKSEAIKISETSQELSQNISEIIWALNTNNDYLENLIAYIRRYAGEYFENAGVSLKVNVPPTIPVVPISGELRRNLFYTVKEALHNIVKHAGASKAEITFTVSNNRFDVIISDNGKGIPEGELNRFGNGLHNMKNRMKSVNGEFVIANHNGTTVSLSLSV